MPVCADCGFRHNPDRDFGCIGKAVSTGQITAKAAAEKFKNIRNKDGFIKVAVKRYEDHQANKSGAAAPAGAAVAPSSDGVSQSCKHVLDSNCRTPQSIWGVAVDDQIRCLECASGENNAIIAAAGCSAHNVGQYCQGKLLIPPTPYTTRSTGYTWTRYVGKDCTGSHTARCLVTWGSPTRKISTTGQQKRQHNGPDS